MLQIYVYILRNISARFSRNSEADASEYLGNLEKKIPGYW